MSQTLRRAIVPFSIILLACAAAAQQTSEPQPQNKPVAGSLAKSLILPGWGQFAERRYIEGALFFGAELACLIGAFRNGSLGSDNYGLYKAAASPEDAVRYRALVEKYDGRRNMFLLAGAAVWALNLLDIYFIVSRKSRPSGGWALGIGRVDGQAFTVMASCRF